MARASALNKHMKHKTVNTFMVTFFSSNTYFNTVQFGIYYAHVCIMEF